jgi:hypothetical protein
LQTIYSEIINEPNFFTDASIKAAKNYCRNPNMNVNGPWCFVQDEDTISMEECDVCQSLGRVQGEEIDDEETRLMIILAIRSTVPTDLDEMDGVTVPGVSHNLLQHIRDDMKRYGAYLREKFREIIDRMTKKFNQIRSRVADHFNWK